MTIASWNIFGIKSHGDAFCRAFEDLHPDVFCLQEVKTSEENCDIMFDGYRRFWNQGILQNNNGVAVFSKSEPISLSFDECPVSHLSDGRIIVMEYDKLFIVCAYVPYSNSEEGLKYRIQWNAYYKHLIHDLQTRKPVICCGDHNIVRSEIDCWDGKYNRKAGCFYEAERKDFESLLAEEHLVDAYRFIHPSTEGFTFWPYNPKSARIENKGFRIDYFLVSREIAPLIRSCEPLQTIQGSCNCPILLNIDIKL